MPTVQFVPTTDDKLLTWSAAFDATLSVKYAEYSFTSAQAAQYTAAHEGFAEALAATKINTTRTPAMISLKNIKRRDLQQLARGFGGMIQRNPGLSDDQKIAIGVTVRKPPTPSPIPATEPVLTIDRVIGHVMEISVSESLQGRKNRKPKAAAGVTLFSYVGAEPPINMSSYKFEGSSTRTTFSVEIDPSVAPGSSVYYTAFWFNSRQQSGPACSPVKAYVQFGGVNKAA